MGADRYVDLLATAFFGRFAAILIEVVAFDDVVLAFGEIDFSSKGQQRCRIEIRSNLIPDTKLGRPDRLRVDDNLEPVAIKESAARFNLNVHRADWRRRFSQKNAIVKLLTNLERQ